MNLPPSFTDPEAKKMLRKLCQENRVDVELLQELSALMLEHSAKSRIDGIDEQIASLIDGFLSRSSE